MLTAASPQLGKGEMVSKVDEGKIRLNILCKTLGVTNRRTKVIQFLTREGK